MRVSITGARGQLGTELENQLKPVHNLQTLDKPAFDIIDERIIDLITGFSPDVVIHCAAYTDVDGCERHPADAHAVNVEGTRNVALACREADAAMVYVSTNYIFDGNKEEPYAEDDAVAPLSVYGKSKLAGEEQVRALLNRFYIVRTAWLYGAAGRNFVNTILTMAESRDTLRVVADQFASPTYAADLADAIGQLVCHPVYGVYHFTNSGSCSWYEWACAILRIAGKDTRVIPIPAEEYQRAATPPRYAVMGNLRGMKLGITLRPWEEALQNFLAAEAAE